MRKYKFTTPVPKSGSTSLWRAVCLMRDARERNATGVKEPFGRVVVGVGETTHVLPVPFFARASCVSRLFVGNDGADLVAVRDVEVQLDNDPIGLHYIAPPEFHAAGGKVVVSQGVRGDYFIAPDEYAEIAAFTCDQHACLDPDIQRKLRERLSRVSLRVTRGDGTNVFTGDTTHSNE